jgi:hypothetical protein
MLAAIECRRCHKTLSLDDYLGDHLMPDDEICLECERRSATACRQCQAVWLSTNSNFEYYCSECGSGAHLSPPIW